MDTDGHGSLGGWRIGLFSEAREGGGYAVLLTMDTMDNMDIFLMGGEGCSYNLTTDGHG